MPTRSSVLIRGKKNDGRSEAKRRSTAILPVLTVEERMRAGKDQAACGGCWGPLFFTLPPPGLRHIWVSTAPRSRAEQHTDLKLQKNEGRNWQKLWWESQMPATCTGSQGRQNFSIWER